jgi:hypothetical protein
MSDLPLKLLELCFNFCYLGSLETDEEPSLYSLFPYYLSEVDPLWKDILLTFPDYWTRVVSHSNTYLESRKNFDVALIHRAGTNPDNVAERARVTNVMNPRPTPDITIRGLHLCICERIPTVYHHRFLTCAIPNARPHEPVRRR